MKVANGAPCSMNQCNPPCLLTLLIGCWVQAVDSSVYDEEEPPSPASSRAAPAAAATPSSPAEASVYDEVSGMTATSGMTGA